ncbi:GntR family transcriptional regulator [Aeoliella sp.]|uniref:GntR family transcriptional regulator n=1 Tax=Aeoliella sp. TaxID=2795800 RepID=UPI003CCC2A30
MSQTRMEFAYAKLRDKVCGGEFPPGHRLVNRTLGKELGVSTVTVREAIHRLASEGLVEHIPNAGAYVREIDRKDMIDLLRLRSKLDCFVVEEVVGKPPHELRSLENICRQWRELILEMRELPDRRLTGEQLKRWLELDSRFHAVLVEVADNAWLSKMVDDLDLNARAMRTKAPYLAFSEAAQTYRHHASITRAIMNEDLEAALFWMRKHGDASLDYLLKHLDDIKPSGR